LLGRWHRESELQQQRPGRSGVQQDVRRDDPEKDLDAKHGTRTGTGSPRGDTVYAARGRGISAAAAVAARGPCRVNAVAVKRPCRLSRCLAAVLRRRRSRSVRVQACIHPQLRDKSPCPQAATTRGHVGRTTVRRGTWPHLPRPLPTARLGAYPFKPRTARLRYAPSVHSLVSIPALPLQRSSHL
jgi:hypothetical protein